MGATIHDIARLAGVSKSTVSRALSGIGLVSEETRCKVLKSAELLNYKPNAIARAMVTKKTGNIGFVIYQKHKPVISHPYYSHILESILEETDLIGYNLFISSDQDIRISSGEILMQKKVDGVILASRVDKRIVINFRNQGIPVVLVNNIVDLDDVCCIVNDDYNGTMELMDYLIRKGHRKIGILCGPLEHLSYSKRYNGYIDAYKKHGINIDYQLIKITDSTLMHGYDAMEAPLAAGNIPTAVFCTNDMMAIGAMKAIKHAGYKIPDDIAVAGFDDIEFSSLVEPALTTVFINKAAIGKTAVEKLKKMIDKQPVDELVIEHKTKLVIREST